MMIIGLSGKAGTGKNMIGSYLKADYGITDYAFASALKEDLVRFGMLTYSEISDAKETIIPKYGKSPRRIMQEYGCKMREIYADFWVDRLFDDIAKEPFLWQRDNVCITDVRFPNEVRAIKERNGYVIRIERPEGLRPFTDSADDISEVALDAENFDHINFDIVVRNDGDKDKLYDLVDNFVQKIFKVD